MNTHNKHKTPSKTAQQTSKVYVMALGDSITFGFPNHYRGALGSIARANGSDLVFRGYYTDAIGDLSGSNNNPFPSQNTAVSGITALTVATTGLIPIWVEAANPDVVLMHLGTNDCWTGLAPTDTIVYLSSIIDQLRAFNPNVIIFAAQIIPIGAGLPVGVQNAIELNKLIKSQLPLKSTDDSPLYIVDQTDGFDPVQDLLTDYLHPTVNGSVKMALKWFTAMQNAGLCPPPHQNPVTNKHWEK